MAATQTEETAVQAVVGETAVQAVAQASAQDQATMIELLQKIQADTALQVKHSKGRLLMVRIIAVVMVAMLLLAVGVTMSVMPKVNALLTQADAVLADAKVLTEQIKGADIPQILQGINQLVVQSESGITAALSDLQGALQKLQSIDIQSLNTAITSLSNIVAPMAKLFGGA